MVESACSKGNTGHSWTRYEAIPDSSSEKLHITVTVVFSVRVRASASCSLDSMSTSATYSGTGGVPSTRMPLLLLDDCRPVESTAVTVV